MTQQKTEELILNKISLQEKLLYLFVSLFGIGVLLSIFNSPFGSLTIISALIFLIILYFYSNIKWYISINEISGRKKLTIIFSLFFVALLICSSIFKLLHWQGSGVLLILSILALTFIPVIYSTYFLIKGKEKEDDYIITLVERNKLKIERIFLILLFLGFAGRFFFIYAVGVPLILNSMFCFGILFICYTWEYYTSEQGAAKRLILYVTSVLAYLIFIVVGLFKLMHWPLPLHEIHDLPFLLIGLISYFGYIIVVVKEKEFRLLPVLLASSLFSVYSFLIFSGINLGEKANNYIYSIPLVLLAVFLLFYFFKYQLFRVSAILIFSYYLLLFPYYLMPNKFIINMVYKEDPQFLQLYEKSMKNYENKVYFEELLKYNQTR